MQLTDRAWFLGALTARCSMARRNGHPAAALRKPSSAPRLFSLLSMACVSTTSERAPLVAHRSQSMRAAPLFGEARALLSDMLGSSTISSFRGFGARAVQGGRLGVTTDSASWVALRKAQRQGACSVNPFSGRPNESLQRTGTAAISVRDRCSQAHGLVTGAASPAAELQR